VREAVARDRVEPPSQTTRGEPIMAKPKPPPPPQPRADDVVVLRQSQEYVEGEIITVLGEGRYRVKWNTGVDYRDRITTVTGDEIRKRPQLQTVSLPGSIEEGGRRHTEVRVGAGLVFKSLSRSTGGPA
jgi:hypothetical protein